MNTKLKTSSVYTWEQLFIDLSNPAKLHDKEEQNKCKIKIHQELQ